MIVRLSQRAEEAKISSLLIAVACALILLVLPVWYFLLRQPPHELTVRFYNFTIEEDAFDISDDFLVFRGGDTILAAPLEYFPENDFARGDWGEIFDRMALLNRYYSDFFIPIALLISVMCILTVSSLSFMLAGVMGLGRKMTHALPYSKRLRVFCVCSWLPAIPSVLVGFFMPIFHIFIYQLILGFLAWKVQKLL